MEGFLPVPDPSAKNFEHQETHLPAEVIMRFSVLSDGDKQVFLHAAGGTATFGRSFGDSSSEKWGLGGGAVRLVSVPSNSLGCQPYDLETISPYEDEPVVVLVQRGDCTFFDKLVLAQQAGAVGVLVYDEPPLGLAGAIPNPQLAFDDGSLIRPSAEAEPEDLVKATEGTGMVFTTYIVGELVKRMSAVEGKVVGVELMPLDDDLGVRLDSASPETFGSGSDKDSAAGSGPREGRLALGEWVIWNLKIVERPP